MLDGEQADVGRAAIRLLGDKLYEIAQFAPADRLAKLRGVAIVVDLDHGKLTSMQYHPGAGWLREHGYDPALAKCVHIPSAPRFVDRRPSADRSLGACCTSWRTPITIRC